MVFLASKKKIEFLKPVEGVSLEDGMPEIKLLVRHKDDKDKANFEKLIEAIKGSKNGKTIGVFSKDQFSNEFCDLWKSTLKEQVSNFNFSPKNFNFLHVCHFRTLNRSTFHRHWHS